MILNPSFERLYYMGNCPICNTYLAPPFDGWCPKCGKQTIGDEPSIYGEIESQCFSKMWGMELTKEEFLGRVKKLSEELK